MLVARFDNNRCSGLCQAMDLKKTNLMQDTP